MQHLSAKQRKEAGFTLVELAIVMIIIGLLIGGILKGQELIKNAQLTATVAQVKSVSTAMNTFRDQFRALPGDITNPDVRLPNCAGDCATAGNGNNQIGTAAELGAPGAEGTQFWQHLHRADLITGVDGSSTLAWGVGLPAAEIAGGFNIGFNAGGNLGNNTTSRGGNYLTIQAGPDALGAAGTSALTPSQAARIDRKMDDGNPSAGSVFPPAVATCAAAAATVYLETSNPLDCELYIRM